MMSMKLSARDEELLHIVSVKVHAKLFKELDEFVGLEKKYSNEIVEAVTLTLKEKFTEIMGV